MRLYGKDALAGRLAKAARADRLPHAVLLHGQTGCGKKVMARYLAGLYIRGASAGENDPALMRIYRDEHPDVIFVKSACGGKYGMDELRAVLSKTVIKPNDGDVKVYVFEDCGDMKAQPQNTLLKLIEEPAPYLRFIFTCENVSSMLETILSRVTEFEIPATSPSECAECLMNEGCLPEKAAELSEMFSGNIGKCRAFLDGGDEAKLIEAARRCAAAVARRDGFSAASALSAQTARADFAETLDYLSEILSDALSLRCGGEARSCGKAEAAAVAGAFGEEDILKMLDAVFEVSAGGQLNLNLALSSAYLVSRLF